MGISKIKFAMLTCICGLLAFASPANAQSGARPVASAVNSAVNTAVNSPVTSSVSSPIFQDAGSFTTNAAPTYFDAQPAPAASSCGCSTCGGGGGIGSRLGNVGGCGLGSRIGSRCGGGLGQCAGGGLGNCNLGDQWKLFGSDCEEPRYNIGGWFSFGWHEESNDLFNSNPDNFNLHQAWFFAEKVAKAENGRLGFGWRFDAIYGIDSGDTQAFGNSQDAFGNARGFDNPFDRGGDFGWAIPQLYGEVAGDNWSAKVGHFYTLAGYEVVTAPDNFFYSHAITMYNSEPFTHTGAVGTFNVSDDLTLYAGWTLGWDTGFDQFQDGSSFLGGFSAPLGDASSLTYITTIGDLGARGGDAYSHSIVVDTAVTDRFNWVVQSDLLRVGDTGEDNVGLNQYFLYSINDCLGVGSRIEWWKGDSLTGYAPHGGVLPQSGSHSYYAATFGVNVKPHANIIVRPEYRVDWSPALGYDEGYFGVDVIALF